MLRLELKGDGCNHPRTSIRDLFWVSVLVWARVLIGSTAYSMAYFSLAGCMRQDFVLRFWSLHATGCPTSADHEYKLYRRSQNKYQLNPKS